MASPLICTACGASFTVSAKSLARFPGWLPKRCYACRAPAGSTAGDRLAPGDVIARYDAGPVSGIFTDGSCEPNPGPGGWGMVKVIEGQIVSQQSGASPSTTNNRMELSALIAGYKAIAPDEQIAVYTDSDLCVKTMTLWAPRWRQNGWSRGKSGGQIKNLDLVQEAFALVEARPAATLNWIKAHAGSRWNEYADALARSYQASP